MPIITPHLSNIGKKVRETERPEPAPAKEPTPTPAPIREPVKV